ncbi:MAG: UDP-3-O-acyl-N-acetylglucosamine deacetylase [Bdellovibrionota bacterium]
MRLEFCHINDVNSMREIGLARGGSLDNAVVVNDSSVINADGLRYKDEFVRHVD